MNPAELPLRDIHLPAPPGWWPPAPGWWVLAMLLAASVAAAWWARARRRRPVGLRTAARAELARIRACYGEDHDAAAAARALSMLLRRVAISQLPRREAAAVHGERWLAVLDRLHGDQAFTRGPGRALATAPYRPAPDVEVEALLGLTEEILRRLPARRRR